MTADQTVKQHRPSHFKHSINTRVIAQAFYLWLVRNFDRDIFHGGILHGSILRRNIFLGVNLPRENLKRSCQGGFSRAPNYADLLASFLDNFEDTFVRFGPFDNNFLVLKANIVGGDWLKMSYRQLEQNIIPTA